nr:MAG TPA: hypothetical protein [Caudoviricetes sp.]
MSIIAYNRKKKIILKFRYLSIDILQLKYYNMHIIK